MEMLRIILFFLIIVDVLSSLISLLDLIPVGNPLNIPRVPLLAALIIIVFQTKQKKKTLYCSTCSKNLTYGELHSSCACGAKNKIVFMGVSGRLFHKCSNKTCRCTRGRAIRNGIRRRTSTLSPYKKNKLFCSVCGTQLSGETAVNLTLYSSDRELALKYRECFFYNGLGPAKECTDMGIIPDDVLQLKNIERHYEKGSSRLNPCPIPTEPISLHFKTASKEINELFIQFNMAIAQSDSNRLRPSDGAILLLDGSKSSIERQSTADHFAVELRRINSDGAVWQGMLLVGICCNGSPELEELIDSGLITSAAGCEEKCRQFLVAQNNEDMIQSLCDICANVRFFFYRSGSIEKGTSEKVYNIVQPVQSLLYKASGDFSKVWKPHSNGFCP